MIDTNARWEWDVPEEEVEEEIKLTPEEDEYEEIKFWGYQSRWPEKSFSLENKNIKEKKMTQLVEQNDISEKAELLKETLCHELTNQEFELFLHVCKRTKLDPFMKQIFAVKRYDGAAGKKIMTIQTSIDGFRLTAERTGSYSPGKESVFSYNEQGDLVNAISYIKKMTPDGTWHEISGMAFYEEYVQRKKDGGVTVFWKRMPHVMLAKCAESIALRRAFPAELSGVYTQDEMSQAQKGGLETPQEIEQPAEISLETMQEAIENNIDIQGKEWLREYLEFCKEKIKKPMKEVLTSWLENPKPFQEHYANWVSKKNLDKTIDVEENEGRQPSLFEEHA